MHFSYPSRPDVKILNGISFDVQRGQTIALVGSSGSGKSTCVQLLQRFYDSDSGSVSIDGHQVTEYNLKWLRQHIGVVSQEPILFQATIRENILFGRDTATDVEVHQAAKMANAHDFIMALPDVSNTLVILSFWGRNFFRSKSSSSINLYYSVQNDYIKTCDIISREERERS